MAIIITLVAFSVLFLLGVLILRYLDTELRSRMVLWKKKKKDVYTINCTLKKGSYYRAAIHKNGEYFGTVELAISPFEGELQIKKIIDRFENAIKLMLK